MNHIQKRWTEDRKNYSKEHMKIWWACSKPRYIRSWPLAASQINSMLVKWGWTITSLTLQKENTWNYERYMLDTMLIRHRVQSSLTGTNLDASPFWNNLQSSRIFHIKVSKEGSNHIVLPSFEAYEPQQQSTWHRAWKAQ